MTMRVAILDVAHWHAPLAKVGLDRANCEVVAVSGPAAAAALWTSRFSCRAYATPAELIEAESIDFAFVFGSHRDQTTTAKMVIERGIACSIEKPAGTCARNVEDLIGLAERAGTFTSVPFVNRLGPVAAILGALAENVGAAPVHFSFTDIAGSPQRYVAAGCPWMLDRQQAGGGCLINLGVHFIDLFVHLGGAPATLAGVALSNRVHGQEIEDHARLLLAGEGGKTAFIEVGYTHPNDEERHQVYTFVGVDWLLDARSEAAHLIRTSGTSDLDLSLDASPLYADYVVETLNACAEGRPPVAGLHDLHAALLIVDAAYHAARAPSG